MTNKGPKLIALIGFLTYCVTASLLLTWKANMERDKRKAKN